MTNREIHRRCRRELKNSSSLQMLEVASNYCNLFISSLKATPYWVNVYREELLSEYIECAKKLHRK